MAGDKSNVRGDKMSAVDGSIADARKWADYLLRKEGGIGDKLSWAAYQAERKYGAPASILLRLRNREVSDMLLSNWIKLKAAYESAVTQVERQAQHQQQLAKDAGANAANSGAYRLASVLVRQKESQE